MGDITHRVTGDVKYPESSDANNGVTSDIRYRAISDVRHGADNDVDHLGSTDAKHHDGASDVKHSDTVDVKDCDDADVKRRDVDSGWAWVVLVASFINLALFALFVVSMGIFQVEFRETFTGSKGFIALIGAMAISGQTLLGPLAGVLSSVLSARVMIMIGGSLACVGMVFASFADDLVVLWVTYGLLAGIGGGLSYTPSVTIVCTYFRKYRVVANGVSLASPGLGFVVAPYLQRWLIEAYGWRYAISVTGCIMAQVCVLASLFYPHDPSTTPSCRAPCRHGQPSDPPEQEAQQPLRAAEDRGLTRLKKEFSSTSTVKDMVGSRTAIHVSEFGSVLLSDSVTWTVDEVTSPSMRKRVSHLLSNRFMWVMALNQVLLMSGYGINSVFFPSFVQSVGVAFRDLPSLYLVYGVALTISRIAGGFAFSRIPSQMIKVYFGCQVSVALLLFFLPYYGVTLPALYAFMFLMAVTFGSAYLLVTPILLHYIGLDDLPVAFGCIMLLCGTGILSAPPLGGMMYDVSGSYTITYHFAGCTVGLAAMSLLLLLLIKDLNPSLEVDVKAEKGGSPEMSDSAASSPDPVEMTNGNPSVSTNDKSHVHVINDVEELKDLIRDRRS